MWFEREVSMRRHSYADCNVRSSHKEGAGVRKKRLTGKPAWRTQRQNWWSCERFCQTKHRCMGHGWNAELWPACWDCRLLLLWRTHREATFLGCVPSQTSSWSSVTRDMFSWIITCRLRTTYPRSWRRELLQEDGDFETHQCTFQREWKNVCAASLRTDKEMGNYWAWFWLVAWWGAREVLSLVGEQSSEQKCSQAPRGWNPVNKNLFPPMRIVASCIKNPRAQALVCLVTNAHYLKGVKEM